MQTNIIKMMGIADIASLLNAISGMLAIVAVINDKIILTATLLMIAVIFDAIDGPLSRKFPNSTKAVFGETIDSLADAISFGLSPAIVLYKLYDQQAVLIISILILSCGILRLSRYNTIITEQDGPTKVFLGLPIPVTSFTLSILLFAQINDMITVLLIMTAISVLMVSSLQYPKINVNRIFPCCILVILTLIYPINLMLMKVPSYLLIILIIIYLLSPAILRKHSF